VQHRSDVTAATHCHAHTHTHTHTYNTHTHTAQANLDRLVVELRCNDSIGHETLVLEKGAFRRCNDVHVFHALTDLFEVENVERLIGIPGRHTTELVLGLRSEAETLDLTDSVCWRVSKRKRRNQ
jgi:hypothetical protein